MKVISLNPSNWGVAAAGTKVKWSSGCSSELRNHDEQQHETCCNASTLAMCKMPALVLRKSALSPVLATLPLIFLLTPSGQPTVCHHFLTDSSFPSSRQSLVFVSYCAGVDVRFPCVCTGNKIHRGKIVQITEALLSAPGKSGVLFSRGGPLATSVGISLHAPFGRRKHQRATYSCILYFLL